MNEHKFNFKIIKNIKKQSQSFEWMDIGFQLA